MNVSIPEIPASYASFREQLRAFITEHQPDVDLGRKAGMRVPEDPEEVAKLRTWVRALHDAGYSPSRFAQTDLDEFERRILHEELARTGVPSVLGNPLVGGALLHFGTELQKQTYLPAIATGEHIWTQLFSEPDAGSDLASLQTRAVLDGDHFVVSGQKVWSTWAQFSDYGYLLARTEPGSGRQGITAFILDMRSPGVTTRPLREITGTSDFNEVFLDSVRIPALNVIGETGAGWKVASASLTEERGGVGSRDSDGSVAGLVRLARTHRRGGRPAIESDAVRQAIGRFAARSHIRRCLGYRVASKAQRGAGDAWDGPLGKIWFSELNLEMADYALKLQGPRGALVEGEPLAWEDGRWQDAFLYARALLIGGGTNEILRNLIAERGLSLPREPRS
jgi:alkylation response protein AidB-like acyl-CoA dehydrogenase